MRTDLKSYPAYRDSGISWLGKVPQHWSVNPAFAMYAPKQVKNLGMVEKTVLSLSYGHIVVKPPEKLHGLVPESFEGYQIVDSGDVIIRATDLQNDRTSLRIGIARHRGIITSAYVCLKVRSGIVPEYGYQVLNTYDLLKILYGYGSGLRQNLDFADIKRMPVPIPPGTEQHSIVRYLAHTDRLVRHYIRTKQKLIALLNEQKQAIADDIVNSAPETNVEWAQIRLKYVAKVQTGLTLGKKYTSGILVSRPYLRVANVQNGFLDLNVVKTIDVPVMEAETCTLMRGDVLMTEGGDIDKLGRGCVWREEIQSCLHQNHVFAVRTAHDRLMPEFLALLMTSSHGRAYFQSTAKQTTNLASTNSTTIKNFSFSLPKVERQLELLELFQGRAQQVNDAIRKVENEISLLRQYRVRLVCDVVTGKLDVREAAANLPAPPNEAEPAGEVDVANDETSDLESELESVEASE